MAFNRELSQFAAYLDLDAAGKYIGITPSESTTNVGIGVTNPGSKLSVDGDVNVTGVVTATQFYGNIDYSYVLNATSGVRTEFSVVDNGGDGSLSYDSQTGIISYVGPSSSEARAHFSATSSDLGSLSYDSATGVFDYSGVTTSNIRDQFSSSSADIGSLAYDSVTGEFSLSGVTTSAIRDQFGASSADIGSLAYDSATGQFSLSGVTTEAIRDQFSAGTGVAISSGEVSIGQPVGTTDGVTFASVNSTGIVTATGGFVGNLTGNVTGDLTGNADTATALETARDFSASGDATAPSVSFDGTGNVDLVLTLADTTVTAGSYGSSSQIPTFTVDSKGRLTAAGTTSVGTDLTVAGDTGSETIQLLNETLTIAGGTNLTSAAASDTVTISLDNDINLDNINATGIVTATSFATGAEGAGIIVNETTITGPSSITLDPAGVGDITGTVYILGDLQVEGTQTIINSTSVSVDDLNILLADGAANDAAANGSGFTVQSGDGNKTFQFEATGDNFGSSENLNLASGKVYKIGNTEVLSTDTLGSGVVNSSLTSVGTLGKLNVGNVNSTGIVTASSGFSGNLTGNVTGDVTGNVTGDLTGNVTGDVTGNVTGDLTGNADTATALETGRDFSASGDATAPAVTFDGTGNVDLALTLANSGVTAGSYGSSSQIPTFTVDSKGRLTAAGTTSVGTDLTVAGDTGSETIQLLNETLTIAGGTNLTSAAAADTVTINLDPNISLTSVSASGVITATSGFVGNVTGDLTGNVTGDLTGNVTGDLTGNVTGDLTGNVTGDLTGNVTGDLTGNVTGDVTGNLTGNVTGDLTGDVTGNVVGNVTGDLTGDVTGNVTGNVTGDVTGNVTGNLTGEVNAAAFDTNANGVVVTGIATATSGFVGNLTGDVTGNADTATALETARDFSASGDATAPSVSFDGTGNVDLVLTLADTTVTAGSYGSSSQIPTFTVDSKGRLTAAGTTSVGTDLTVAGDSGSETISLLSETLTISGGTNLTSSAAADTVTINLDDNISLTSVSASGVITATSGFSGNLTGNVTGNVTGDVTGNADTATALETGRDFSASGDATAPSVSFDGTGNVDLVLTLADTAVSAGSYGSGSEIPTFTVDSKGRLTAAGTVAVSTGMTVSGDTGSENINLLTESLTIAGGTNLTSAAAADTVTINLDPDISLTSVTASGIVSATGGFTGDLTGNVTGNVTGNLTGEVNAAAFDTNANGVVVTGVATATSGFSGNLTGNVTGDLTGNADTATALETSRDFSASGDATAPSVSFDGTGNVDLVLTLADTTVTAGSYGSSSQIPTFTVDSKGRLTAAGTTSVGTDLTVAGDTGSETISLLTETLTIAGGTNLTSSAAADTVTINLDNDINLDNINASGIVTATSFATGAEGTGIIVNQTTITGPSSITLDPSGIGDITGTVYILGDLQVDGTQTIINSTSVSVDDLNILLADGAINDAAANGSGFTVQSGDGNKTFQFEATGDNFGSSENVNLASGKVYKINNTEVLSSDTLGSGVVNSSLTSVGTLGELVVSGVTTSSGGFSGDLTGNVTGDLTGNVTGNVTGDVTGNVTGNLTGEVNAAAFDTNANGVVVTGVATATGGFSGNLTGDVTGNADTATALETGRTISLSGDLAGSVLFDGTSNVSIAATIQPNSVALGDDTTGNYVATIADAGNTNISVSNSGTENAAVTLDLTNTGVTAGAYGSATAIPTFTVDAKGRLTVAGSTAVGTGLTINGDTGSDTVSFLSESLTISGGTNLNSSVASDTVTINLDPNISLTSISASGVVTATSGFVGNLIGDVTGNADTATALETARDFSISGDATASAISFDGTANVGLALTLADTGVAAGSYGSATAIPTFTVDSKGRLTVAGEAVVSTGMTVAGDSGTETINLLTETLTIAGGTNLTSSAAADTVTINLDDNISLINVNASGVVTATSGFVGDVTGNVTGDLTGNVTGDVTGDLTGNVYASSGISTFNNLYIAGTLTDVNSGVGSEGQFLISVGTGVSWSTLTDSLPETRTTQSFTATNGQTVFNFNYNVNYLDVFVNGVKLSSAEFTATNGTDITLAEAAFSGDIVELISYSTVGTGSGSVNSLNDLTDVTLTGSTSGQILSYNGSGWVNTSTLSGITALDATTTATIESAVAAAPNDFTSLNISGVSTFTGAVDANGGANISGGLEIDTINASGIVTASAFYGDGSNLTGIDATSLKDSGGNVIVQANESGIVVTGIITATSFASPSLTGTPTAPTAAAGTNTTQVATTEFVSTAVANLIDTAPATLDTLNELAAALGDDPNFATTVSTAIGTKLDSADYNAADVLTKIKTVDGSTSGLDADLLDGQDGSYYLDWTNVTNKPDPTITLAGDLSGSVTLTDLASGTLTATIAANSVALGTDTTGNYAATVAVSGTGLSLTGSAGEGTSYTITSNATSANTGSTIVARDASGNFTAGTITATDFNSTSDINLKKDIEVIADANTILNQIDGVRFTWKESGRRTAGVIAQTVEAVMPELIGESEGHKTVNFDGLVGLLIEAVKEQGKQIEALKAEIAELKK